MMRTWLRLSVLLLLAGCIPGAGNDVKNALKTQKAAWIAMGVHNYSYVYEELCFCPSVRPLLVTVKNDVVISVTDANDGSAVSYDAKTAHFSVPQLYDFLITEAGRADNTVAQFDLPTHMPARVDFDYHLMAIDDELSVTATLFTAK